MQVWIGFKQNEEYVHEWTGEVAGEGDVGKAIGNALADSKQERQGHLGNVHHGRQSPTAVRDAAPPGAVPGRRVFSPNSTSDAHRRLVDNTRACISVVGGES